ncbi:GAF domain-containing protein [Sphingomonas guangdongensis]|uniref:GAF domain-containing protein n=1 Tax=Sphingomonas guangdongensis TaxID=1141890 RepID=A0A285QYT6_9SPHN|nr:GAF domain-containing protein [Sphingomonas guangdongensis]SOB87001.1 GAF domain-containing protein [Sphingomonas guangdongensis]
MARSLLHFLRPAPADPLKPLREDLALGRSVASVVEALRTHARTLTAADGITLIERRGDEVHYLTEDAISPLWTGQSFPLRMCVSGMAMVARAPIVIPDVSEDKRVPLNLYLATFIRSMVMVPIGHGEPLIAMGVYWREPAPIAAATISTLTRVAELAADALDRIGDPPPSRQAA